MKQQSGSSVLAVIFVTLIISFIIASTINNLELLILDYQSIKSFKNAKLNILGELLVNTPSGSQVLRHENSGKEIAYVKSSFRLPSATRKLYQIPNHYSDCEAEYLKPMPSSLPFIDRTFISASTCNISNFEVQSFQTDKNIDIDIPNLLIERPITTIISNGYVVANSEINLAGHLIIVAGGSVYISSIIGDQSSALSLVSLSGAISIERLDNYRGKIYLDSHLPNNLSYPISDITDSPIFSNEPLVPSKGWVSGIFLGKS